MCLIFPLLTNYIAVCLPRKIDLSVVENEMPNLSFYILPPWPFLKGLINDIMHIRLLGEFITNIVWKWPVSLNCLGCINSKQKSKKHKAHIRTQVELVLRQNSVVKHTIYCKLSQLYSVTFFTEVVPLLLRFQTPIRFDLDKTGNFLSVQWSKTSGNLIIDTSNQGRESLF